ncbi:MAG: hypothetical protein KG028_07095, partial [Actinobacteria bacterium]|nr:hypothetical protein [Actinomycetota bacterium]
DVCDNVFGRSFCALGDGMTSSITSGLQYFRDEFEAHIREARCPLGTTEPRRDIPMLEPQGGAGYAPETGAAQIPAMPARSTAATTAAGQA